ncbi:formyl transferase [Rhodanobacter hydrolyticus]|uniref:phosphoribosylglycinamide formyltransferase 1 n=2 Tax=Rhodanobacter hydrolyticus TaxID=2250595 RepID=A0ABW8J248_9GAMM
MSRRIPRIVMLCGDGPSSRFLYNALAGEMEILAVVTERKPSARSMIRYRVSQLGWFTVIGQLAFIAFNRLLARLQRRRSDALILRYGLHAAAPPEAIAHQVDSINTAAVRRLLRKLDPDAVVVNGTRIISRKVIDCIQRPFINTHAGITPRYRGVHGGYWALVHDDVENCGVTVHLVDAGVDTGGVLYQQRIRIEDSDGFNTYPLHQLAAGIPLMKQALHDVVDGTLVSRDGVSPSRLWYHPTLGQYLRYRLTKSVR